MTAKRKHLAPAPPTSRTSPRDPIAAPGAAESRGYPSFREALAMPDVMAVLKAFGRAAAYAGVVAAAAAMSGCEDPQCGTTRLEELEAHAGPTWEHLKAGELELAVEQVGRGSGLGKHPPIPIGTVHMAGLMVPTLPPPPPPSDPDGIDGPADGDGQPSEPETGETITDGSGG